MTAARPGPPREIAFRYLDHDGPAAFAHRGGATRPEDLVLENSKRAFARAVELGYRYLETDVHATRDEVVVAFHDETLDRATTGCGEIAALPYSEVRAALIAGTEPIPTLAELLAAWPDVRWNIDVKSEAAILPLARTLREADAFDRVCVASFSERRLRRARTLLGPEVATALGPVGVAVLRFVPWHRVRRRLLPARVACVQVPVQAPMRFRGRRWAGFRLVTTEFVRRAHEHGVAVHVWTIDDRSTMHELLDLGVDGIISDRIDVLKEVLVGRGHWKTGPA